MQLSGMQKDAAFITRPFKNTLDILHQSRLKFAKKPGMHHALLNGSIPAVTEFDKVVHNFEDGHVIVLDVMRMIGQEGLVFITRTHEPELVQELFIQLRPARRAQADLLLSVMNLGKPLATRGSSEAVRAGQ